MASRLQISIDMFPLVFKSTFIASLGSSLSFLSLMIALLAPNLSFATPKKLSPCDIVLGGKIIAHEEAIQHRNIIHWSKLFHLFSPAIQIQLQKNWGIDLHDQDIVIKGLDHVRISDDFYKGCGQCDLMAIHHFEGILQNGGTLVTWDKKLIGVLKNKGEPSMFVLNNVYNANGKLILVKGGVYAVHYKIADSWESVVDLKILSAKDSNVLRFNPMGLMRLPHREKLKQALGLDPNLRAEDFYGEVYIKTIEEARRRALEHLSEYSD